jgi:hypothetical protein
MKKYQNDIKRKKLRSASVDEVYSTLAQFLDQMTKNEPIELHGLIKH